ncbi:hypothetical protein PLICRDRAFT_693902 [Plicaturopsis crispa FD-325 SS-3]|nr:hypothetical protein PLICRDRAFT_693902 [Plicaturopsis crispa FD-325 SS-3]
MQGLGKVPALPWDEFEHYLPPNCVDIPAVVKLLKKRRHIAKNRWTAFATDPMKMKGDETKVFKHLDTAVIAKIVCASAECLLPEFRDRKPTSKPMQNPHKIPESTDRTNASRPDGVMLLLESEYEWDGIVSPEEFKKFIDAKSAYDNKCKIIWSLHHIMRSDPCRRFTFGITIDNVSMRVWLCSRACMVVSDAFNFTTDFAKVIRVYSSLAFGTKTELGWDPTFRSLPGVSPKQYEIDVFEGPDKQKNTYSVVKIIWDVGAEFSQGRATRVYEALDAAGDTFAIKDVWREQDRDPEGDILKAFHTKISGGTSKVDKELFMEMTQHGDVIVDNNIDDSLHTIMHGRSFPEVYGYLSLLQQPKSDAQRPGGHAMRRVHYRIVFPGVGLAIHELDNLGERLVVLRDAVKGLKIMSDHNHVHRDVSVGNLLAFRRDGQSWTSTRGKLSDFEYAIDMASEALAHSIRTGTIDYMAMFQPDLDDIDDSVAEDSEPAPLIATPDVVFRHNFLHDLESTWWIASWNVFAHVPLEIGDPSWSPHSLRDVAANMFPGYAHSRYRERVFKRRHFFANLVTSLPPAMRPLVNPLERARQILVKAYKIAEKSRACIDHSAFVGVHEKLALIYKEMADLSGDMKVQSLYDFNKATKRKTEPSEFAPSTKRRKT